MELKATLKDYTEPEFQALVNRIWVVDLPKRDHDRLINHFDRIVGHPKGADLFFYPDDQVNTNGAGSIVFFVKNWHRKRGMAAFKDENVSVSAPPVQLSDVARSLAEVQEIAADVAVSERAVETAFSFFEQGIKRLRSQQSLRLDIPEQDTNIRALERTQHETLMAISKFEFCKMRVEFAKRGAQRDMTYARSEQARWQSLVQQINSTHDRYIARLAGITQRHRVLHDEAEALLIAAQEQLIRSRNLAGTGPAQAACAMTASLDFADKRPDVLLEGGPSALLVSQRTYLQKAIRSAVAQFAWQNTSGEPPDDVQCAAVLRFEFSSRADTQVYGLSVPLAELLPIEGQDWQSLAANRAEVDVPFRMTTALVPAEPGTMFQGLREIKTLSQVHITPSKGSHPASGVRVRAAQLNERLNTFSFTADGAAPITVYWSAPVTLEASPPVAPAPSHRLGFVRSLPVPILETSTGEEDARFDDYIVVFPIAAGLDPVYVTFRDRREYPDMTIAEA
ncbi:S-type pyocin domain-containing protein [Pseudomonas sp. MDT1-16]